MKKKSKYSKDALREIAKNPNRLSPFKLHPVTNTKLIFAPKRIHSYLYNIKNVEGDILANGEVKGFDLADAELNVKKLHKNLQLKLMTIHIWKG
jgi:hypothetical protein